MTRIRRLRRRTLSGLRRHHRRDGWRRPAGSSRDRGGGKTFSTTSSCSSLRRRLSTLSTVLTLEENHQNQNTDGWHRSMLQHWTNRTLRTIINFRCAVTLFLCLKLINKQQTWDFAWLESAGWFQYSTGHNSYGKWPRPLLEFPNIEGQAGELERRYVCRDYVILNHRTSQEKIQMSSRQSKPAQQ